MTSAPGKGETRGWFALAQELLGTLWALVSSRRLKPLFFQTQLWLSHPAQPGKAVRRRAGQPWLHPCLLAGSSLEGSGITATFGWVNLGVTCCSAELLPAPDHQATCRQRAAVRPARARWAAAQPSPARAVKGITAALGRWERPDPGDRGGLRSRHCCLSTFLPLLPARSIAACPSSPPRAAPLPHTCSGSRGPRACGTSAPCPEPLRQPRGGSLRAGQELMLQMMPLSCQLLNPAQAPAEICLNSGNCTNMVLFLPRAKPYSPCITLGCFLKLLLAQSRAGLVRRHAARTGLALLAPVPAPVPPRCGHPPAQTPVPAAAAGDGCLVLEGFDAAGHRVPPGRGSVGGCSRQAEAAAGWDRGWGEPGQSEAPAGFSSFGGLGRRRVGDPVRRGIEVRHRR